MSLSLSQGGSVVTFVGVRTPHPALPVSDWGASQGASCRLQAALQELEVGGGNEEEAEGG